MRPDPVLIKKLIEVVELAKAGDCKALAFTGIASDGSVVDAWYTGTNGSQADLLAGIDKLKTAVTNKPDGGLRCT